MVYEQLFLMGASALHLLLTKKTMFSIITCKLQSAKFPKLRK